MTPSSIKMLGLCLAFLLLYPAPSQSARHFKDRVELTEATGEANPRLDQVEFDPLVMDAELLKDDKKWEQQHHMDLNLEDDFPEEFMEHGGDMFMDDGEGLPVEMNPDMGFLDFNITERLLNLFPQIDHQPKDGKVTLEELTKWHLQLERRNNMHRTKREMSAADADKNEKADLQEALSEQGVGDPSEGSFHDQRAILTERFLLADADKDALLNMTEYNDFLHPGESNNTALRDSLIKEEIRNRDMNGDGKVSYEEFEQGMYHELMQHDAMLKDEDPAEAARKHLEEEGHHDPHRAPHIQEKSVRERFNELDTDRNGFIEELEFRPLMSVFWPGQEFFAVSHSKEIIRQADGDHDGALTLEEMLANPHIFYHTVSEPEPLHDEL